MPSDRLPVPRWQLWPDDCDLCGNDATYILTRDPRPDWARDGDTACCLSCGAAGYVVCDSESCAEIHWPCLPGEHLWRTTRQGGDPAEIGSYERITFCIECGGEYDEDHDTL